MIKIKTINIGFLLLCATSALQAMESEALITLQECNQAREEFIRETIAHGLPSQLNKTFKKVSFEGNRKCFLDPYYYDYIYQLGHSTYENLARRFWSQCMVLAKSAHNGDQGAAKKLKQSGLGCDAMFRGSPVLYWAIKSADVHVCKYLLESGVPIDKGNEGLSPLQQAVFWGKIEIAKLLIDAGADVYHRNNGSSILLQARMGAGAIACKLVIEGMLRWRSAEQKKWMSTILILFKRVYPRQYPNLKKLFKAHLLTIIQEESKARAKQEILRDIDETSYPSRSYWLEKYFHEDK